MGLCKFCITCAGYNLRLLTFKPILGFKISASSHKKTQWRLFSTYFLLGTTKEIWVKRKGSPYSICAEKRYPKHTGTIKLSAQNPCTTYDICIGRNKRTNNTTAQSFAQVFNPQNNRLRKNNHDKPIVTNMVSNSTKKGAAAYSKPHICSKFMP